MLACFIQKKKEKKLWALPPPKHLPGPAPPPPLLLLLQSFLALPKAGAPIFFLYYPLIY